MLKKASCVSSFWLMELCGTSPVLLVSFSILGDMHKVCLSPLLEPQSIIHTKKPIPISFCFLNKAHLTSPMMSFHEACVRLNGVVIYEGFKAVLFIPCSPGIYVRTYNMTRRLPCYSHSEFFSEPSTISLSLSHIPSFQLSSLRHYFFQHPPTVLDPLAWAAVGTQAQLCDWCRGAGVWADLSFLITSIMSHEILNVTNSSGLLT